MSINILIFVIGLVGITALGCYVYNTSQLKQKPDPLPSDTSSLNLGSSDKASITTNTQTGWKIYTSYQYGFEIQYPPDYQAVYNRSGWPNSIVLIYNKGQSYDLGIEFWETESEYKSKYFVFPDHDSILTIYKTKDGKFITLSNMNNDPQVSEIIKTFKFNK